MVENFRFWKKKITHHFESIRIISTALHFDFLFQRYLNEHHYALLRILHEYKKKAMNLNYSTFLLDYCLSDSKHEIRRGSSKNFKLSNDHDRM